MSTENLTPDPPASTGDNTECPPPPSTPLQNTTGPGAAQGNEPEIIHRQSSTSTFKKHTQKHSGTTYQTTQTEEKYTTT